MWVRQLEMELINRIQFYLTVYEESFSFLQRL